jgi:antitoxin ParD1/3/4
MSKVEKISISLPKEMVASMKDVVASGTYASTSEIMRDALRGWQEKQEKKAKVIAKYRKLIQEALDSGPPVPFVPGDVARRGRERYAAMMKKSA